MERRLPGWCTCALAQVCAYARGEGADPRARDGCVVAAVQQAAERVVSVGPVGCVGGARAAAACRDRRGEIGAEGLAATLVYRSRAMLRDAGKRELGRWVVFPLGLRRLARDSIDRMLLGHLSGSLHCCALPTRQATSRHPAQEGRAGRGRKDMISRAGPRNRPGSTGTAS